MFYVEITENLITAKGEGEYKTDEQIEISESIYNELTSLPAEFTELDGQIINVSPLPLPEPEPLPPSEIDVLQDKLNELEQLLADLASLQLGV